MIAAGRGICRPLSAKGSAGASKPLGSTQAQAAFIKAYSFGQRILEAKSVHIAATTLVDASGWGFIRRSYSFQCRAGHCLRRKARMNCGSEMRGDEGNENERPTSDDHKTLELGITLEQEKKIGLAVTFQTRRHLVASTSAG